jgi:hypothetical protein
VSRRFVFNAMSILYIALIASTPFLFFGKGWEEKYAPVVGKAFIRQLDPKGPNTTWVWVEFKKLRNCEFKNLTFYLKDRFGIPHRIEHEFLIDRGAPPVSRPEGIQWAGPWRVNARPEDFIGRVSIITNHKCHPLWETQTQMYP